MAVHSAVVHHRHRQALSRKAKLGVLLLVNRRVSGPQSAAYSQEPTDNGLISAQVMVS